MPDSFSVRALCNLMRRLRDAVLIQRAASDLECLGDVHAADGEGDTIYRIDRAAEEALIRYVEEELAWRTPCWLIAEGIRGREGLPLGGAENQPRERCVRLLVDPIDGTRGLMTDKRSAWALCGLAPDRGEATTLEDIHIAVMTEIPTIKQWRSDTYWAVRDGGAFGEWEDVRPLVADADAPDARRPRGTLPRPRPSTAKDLAHGFASFAKFFPGARDVLSKIEEEVIVRVVGRCPEGRALVFEDQYISTGGQLHELMTGRDRFIADLRPLMNPGLARRGLPRILTSHPYDLATVLIAREAGVIVTAPDGGPLRYPLDTETECSWIGYANPSIHDLVAPNLRDVLRDNGLMPPM